ncbi:hypothetical protein RUMHYD_00797 [Blautia hydrogenotrophica DSM 10507]|uniref:Uncharacterized protein n=1 Tax=Blautia hydrogenotrophica (strain DSM 10507 / JCM 14656 / S5a33) TaxID=476272 RepID=C0CIY0_BLAHS|nr:hypothetical protein RUMHYD_00797 [Blautia hydrogenotrophica DSM 10507]
MNKPTSLASILYVISRKKKNVKEKLANLERYGKISTCVLFVLRTTEIII